MVEIEWDFSFNLVNDSGDLLEINIFVEGLTVIELIKRYTEKTLSLVNERFRTECTAN